MNLSDRIKEARHRQALRGRLRWLLDDFCSRELGPLLRPGELLDLADDVRAFAGASDEDLGQDDLRRLQAKIRGGLLALFQPKDWVLDSLGMVLAHRHTESAKPLKPLRTPRWLVKGGGPDLARLLLPLQLQLAPAAGPERKRWSFEDRFCYAAAKELEGGWQQGKSLVGRCGWCANFFYRVRRQTFCSLRCKTLAMDTRKAERRNAPGRRPDAGRTTRKEHP